MRQLEHLCHQRDKDGNTPLHLAASLGNIQAMENGLLNAEIWDEASSDVDEKGSDDGGSDGGSEGGGGEGEGEGGGSEGEGEGGSAGEGGSDGGGEEGSEGGNEDDGEGGLEGRGEREKKSDGDRESKGVGGGGNKGEGEGIGESEDAAEPAKSLEEVEKEDTDGGSDVGPEVNSHVIVCKSSLIALCIVYSGICLVILSYIPLCVNVCIHNTYSTCAPF